MLHIERRGALIRRGLEAGSEGRVGRVFFLLSKEFEAGKSKESERFVGFAQRDFISLCIVALLLAIISFHINNPSLVSGISHR